MYLTLIKTEWHGTPSGVFLVLELVQFRDVSQLIIQLYIS